MWDERIVIVGHSFVRRLMRTFYNLSFPENRTEVQMCGYVGRKPIALISDLEGEDLEWIVNSYGMADLYILVIGTNDLASRMDLTCNDLADRVKDIALKLLQAGIKHVAIVEVLPRFGENAFRRANHVDAQQMFIYRMLSFNTKIKYWEKQHLHISYLPLKGLHKFVVRFLLDGLHLSLEGMKIFKRELRKGATVNLLRSKGPK